MKFDVVEITGAGSTADGSVVGVTFETRSGSLELSFPGHSFDQIAAAFHEIAGQASMHDPEADRVLGGSPFARAERVRDVEAETAERRGEPFIILRVTGNQPRPHVFALDMAAAKNTRNEIDRQLMENGNAD